MLKGFSNLSGFSNLQDGVGTQSREIEVEEKGSESGKGHASNETTKSPQEAEKVNDEIRNRDRLHINALGKRMGCTAALRILAILRYEASKTSPSSGWVVVHSYNRCGYVGTIMHVYP